MRIVQTKSRYEITFRYNPVLVSDVKQIQSRRYHDKEKMWSVGLAHAQDVAELAKKYHVEIEVSEGAERVSSGPDFSDLHIPELPHVDDFVFEQFRRAPFPFQKTGVAYLLEKKRAIQGDQMGLGKTGQSIMATTAAEAFPCLVICPATLRENWRREWTLWTNHRAVILNDTIRYRWPMMAEQGRAQVFIVNYESLSKYFVAERKQSEKLTLRDITFHDNIKLFKSVIIDEFHRCKATSTLQSKLVKGICADKEYVFGLTGTPVVNKPNDLISQLSIIGRLPEFGGYKPFVRNFCEDKYEGALDYLNAHLRRTCFVRREKHEVLHDLPSKTRQVIYCEIDNRKEYQEAELDLADYLKKYRNRTDEEVEASMRGELMVKMGALKNISARGKLKTVFDFVDDIMESGEKLVLFGHLHEVLDKIKARYPHAVSVTGNDTQDERTRAIDAFQNDENCKLIVCGIKAAGVGITLTAASRVAFVEFAWHPADHDQCEDRCHRIGQHDNVQCTYFAGKNTIDEHIYNLIEEKRAMTAKAVGAIDVTNVSVVDDVLMMFENEGTAPVENEDGSATLF